jgi:DNA-binding CsgD family transcriptional regulator
MVWGMCMRRRDDDLPRDLRAAVVELPSGRYLLLSHARGSVEVPALTPAERHVALALLDGRSNAEIAALRGSSPRTIANQVASLYRKLGVGSRAELAARWAGALAPVVS